MDQSAFAENDRVKHLKSLMGKHSALVLGEALPAVSDLVGLDEVDADHADDYRDLRRIEPTKGSRQRRLRFAMRSGKNLRR